MVLETCSIATEELLGPLDDFERRNAPERLYFAGDTSLITCGARVSIVGSRRASGVGIRRARKLAHMLTRNGVVVVSGLAEGIDTAAHIGAIDAGGRTIAVLGTPLEKVYPTKNRELQARIMNEHLAVSQFAPGSSWDSRSFPMRNRTMALLSDATVIVEAGPRSGTIHMGWETLRLGRALYVLESLQRAGHGWVSDMMGHGAEVLSDSNCELFIETLPAESRSERRASTF